ncbi:MAG: Rieske 2Fe-2S domain-containing protein [Nitrospira sp.]|nr:Rieske 2Fe-2S domain-containing protein [Nitrospira sp.]
MLAQYIEQDLDEVSVLKEGGKQLAQAVHQAVLKGGEPTRTVVDMLHGTWLGHPLHPILTDVVIGAWTLAALCDLMSLNNNSSQVEQAADNLITLGTMAAIPTAPTGLADFSTIPNPVAGTGLTHAIMVDLSLGCYVTSLQARKKGERSKGIFWSMLGFGAITLGAYLGGHMVYRKKVGVNQTEAASQPESWRPIMSEVDLPDHEPKRVEVEGQPWLLYRRQDRVYATSAVCPHAAGPLEEGQFRGRTVQCPWHDSVFDLQDGCIIHGPSTHPLPAYEARIQDGQVEVRALTD